MPQRILITAVGPLVFPARKPDTQFSQSLGYVPGIALWGALGMQLGETPSARFANALPARACDTWVRVLPNTAMSCKHQPGFLRNEARFPNDERPPHGAFDTLIDRACWEALASAGLTYDPHCPACLGRADTFGGFYAPHDDAPHDDAPHDDSLARYVKREAAQRLLTRVAIDRRRGTAAEGQLYSPLALAEVATYKLSRDKTIYEQICFLGRAWDLEPKAKAALEQVDVLGGRRSSGLGQVRISVSDEPAADDLAARLRNFNAAFHARWALMQAAAPTAQPDWDPAEWTLFSVGLQTEAVLLEDGWRPTIVISPAQLRDAAGIAAEPVRAWANTRVAGGWNLRWNRHRPTALTVPAGAVYLFRSQAGEQAIAAALATLEEHGIGERRAEGYGIVRCCDEFHVQKIGEPV